MGAQPSMPNAVSQTIGSSRVKKKGLWNELKTNKVLFLMLLPAIFFFIVFHYIPMAGIYIAFTQYNYADGIFGSPFIGFKNFEFLYMTGDLFRITKNTVLYNLVFILLGNALQIVAAIFLSRLPLRWFNKTSQSIMFLPHFISYVLIGAFVYNILNYEFGTLNSLLKGMGFEPVDLYSNTGAWPFIIVFFYVWKSIGIGSIIYLAAILNVNEEYYEAARIDGANIWQEIRHITLPFLKPTFVILLLLSIGGILRGQFDLFYQIIGNAGHLYPTTDIIDTYAFRALVNNFDMGIATAVGLYQSFFGFILLVIVNFIVKKINEDYSLF